MTSTDTLPTPATAYWNQREALAHFRPRAERLQAAISHLGDLSTYQWAQLFVMALEFRPDLIIELGRGAGNSTCVFTEAANRLGGCRVVSLDVGSQWNDQTLAKVREIVPEGWLEPLQALEADILTFDYAAIFAEAKRVLIFWDAHGFEIAECVLGRVLPLIQGMPHLVMMHDMSDVRYLGDETRPYGDNRLWTGQNAETPWFVLGHIFSRVAQAISIVDFTSRNQLPLHSAGEELHAAFDVDTSKRAELEELLGDELFSLSTHWYWFSLNDKPGPYTFPKFDYEEIRQKVEQKEKMRVAYFVQQNIKSAEVTNRLRLKIAAKILLNRYGKDFLNGIIWDVTRLTTDR